MSMIEQLNAMEPDQIRDLAVKQGVKVHHKAGKDTMIKAIVESLNPQVQPETITEAPVKPEPIMLTEEEVLAAIKPFTDKGMQVKFPGDGTWMFKFRGAEDSGHMTALMQTVKLKAATVARGAVLPKGHKVDEFGGPITSNPNSAYANAVLTGT